MLLLWWAAVFPAICLVNAHLKIFSECGGEQTKKINHSLWWASDPREVPDLSTKTYSFITVTQLDMAIPVKMWQRDSLSLPSPPLLFALSLHWLFQGELYTGRVIFFPCLFVHFGCENVSLFNGHGGKGQKGSKQKTNKGLICHAGRSWTVTGHFTYAHT